MNKNDFTELAYNDHRTALLVLWDRQALLEAELVAAQETIIELSAALHAPSGEAEPATK